MKQTVLQTALGGLIVLWGIYGQPAQAAEKAQDCASPVGVVELMTLENPANSAMHEHVTFVTCIASSLAAGNYENASYIAEVKLGLLTKGGMRSGKFGYHETSQRLWERGNAFRKQATLFAASAKAAFNVPNPENRARANTEYIVLLSLCQDCHAQER